ncbi:hypothetical protein AR457_30655 [Streptomyces agglomeratus]|uniref:Uncharacterized protein n=1 Tax=Streptomyces agglomeratus TaxID=285458 RepID=A0A1E5PJW4_9ACTN|nr:DUF6332 family protein [Streptomyces agglomeratus]OEJ29812.1 hypothetical protein AS594_30545 [Streptomyces agglomeratus]OEJ47863.1 hypothetical protein AR457_30655 [Streptomyces agglomeratus]
MGTRTQAQRDAMTIEIGYAVLSAAVLAGVTFAAVTAPWYLLGAAPGPKWVVLVAGCALAAAVFVLRVVHVLAGYRGAPGTQPSQPGRTRPDS